MWDNAVTDSEKETKAQQKELGTADIARIMKLLPHRYPFLLVDKIVEMDGDQSAVGIKNVTINEPFFVGHFPNNPVMPGVLIVEAIAQSRVIVGYTSYLKSIADLTAGKEVVASGMTIPWSDMRAYLEKRISGKPAKRPAARKLAR